MIEQLIQDISYTRISLSEALLRAKYISYKIKNETFNEWLKKELEGYDFVDKNLPQYRKIISPSWIVVLDSWGNKQNLKIQLPDSFGKEVLDTISYHRVIESISIVERQIESFNENYGTLTLPEGIIEMFRKLYKPQLDPQGGEVISTYREVNKLQYIDILEQTKNKLIDILIELSTEFPEIINEKNMKEEDKAKIQNIITNNIYGSNNPLNIAAGDVVNQTVNSNFGKVQEDELKTLGVSSDEVEELRGITKIVEREEKTSKVKSWLSSVSASVAARGLYEGIPRIIEIANNFM
ncbi:AbiTii domain-containing protein [Sphingobacterium hungaricum]